MSVEGDAITATEIKWNEKKNVKMPRAFVEAYQPVKENYINRENYLQILTGTDF